ncbi:hypothetical protein SAMN04488117_108132 [Celeribacter baekdonensis]|jgi:hypothetical protein|uniref:Uncharacterized protein n=1 Tax=Celeribacter baekdonensis TaxID=875171 RepID=A0A1G7PRS8_9RHOB|nr:hypothetical protein [Celeribacter baekdonensis]SDF89007.1 hypothetical protein SAMN04488117_108132 [Celeribacter baekdonensis]
MCSLCGILGCDDHWTNAIVRPGVYTRNHDTQSRRAEGMRRLKSANAVLSYRRLKLDVWQGRSYVMTSPTGGSSVFEALSHLWSEAEALSGRDLDPLDDDLIEWMEERTSL